MRRQARVRGVGAGVVKAFADADLGLRRRDGRFPPREHQERCLPVELGLAETQQSLVQNQLRGRVVLRADGGLSRVFGSIWHSLARPLGVRQRTTRAV